MLILARADIGSPKADKLFSKIIIDWKPVTLGDRLGDPHTQPFDIFLYHLIGVRIDSFWVRILDPENVPASVLFYVSVVERRSPGVPDMEGPGVRCKPHDHTMIRPFKIGQYLFCAHASH